MRLLAATLGLLLATAPVPAQTLRIAMAAEPTAADPQQYAAAPNSTLHDHVFESLVDLGAAEGAALARAKLVAAG